MRDQCSPVCAPGIILCGIWDLTNRFACHSGCLTSLLHQNPTEADGEAPVDFGRVWVSSWCSFSFLFLFPLVWSLVQGELESSVCTGGASRACRTCSRGKEALRTPRSWGGSVQFLHLLSLPAWGDWGCGALLDTHRLCLSEAFKPGSGFGMWCWCGVWWQEYTHNSIQTGKGVGWMICL